MPDSGVKNAPRRRALILQTELLHPSVPGLTVTQRVQLLDTTMASQANVRVCFKMTDKNDIGRVSSYFANPQPARHATVGAFIANMSPCQALYVNEKDDGEAVIHTTKITGFDHFG